jgi:Porin subfamily
MKMVKSLFLGSAAGLLAMSGAQAADLPVKAKAVEYVKICSLYGAGFYYIPGTDTCIKIGGYLRVETAFNASGDFTGGTVAGNYGQGNRYRNYFLSRSREDLNIDTRTATEYGVVRTYWDATFSWTTANPQLGGTFGNAGIAGSDTIGVYHAFIQFAGFTMGKTISQFDAPWSAYPGNNFDGLVGGGGDVTGVNQLTYTAQFGNGVSGTISLQDPYAYYQSNLYNTSFPGVAAGSLATTIGTNIGAGAYGTQSLGGVVAPDIVGVLKADQAWGGAQLSIAAHDNHAGYYSGGLTGIETLGHPDDKWGWAIQGALWFKNVPTGPGDTINMQAVYTNGATRYNLQSLATQNYVMFGGTGLPGAYQSLGFAAASDAVFAGIANTAANATQLQLTTTYGFRGGFNHNFDPYWSGSLYGAWAAVQYNGTATALICANITPFLSAGSTCNPNFNVFQVGGVIRWTPVKNLTFSADLLYQGLDQKYTGAVTLPATAVIPTKPPGATYELKDQQAVSLLLRAQRNF